MADKETVSVGCKIPNGIRLHVMKRIPHGPDEPAFKDMGFIDLAGYQSTQALAPGVPQRTEAFTAVDKEIFDVWFTENKENSLVTSGAIFVPESAKDQPETKAEADEAETEASRAAANDSHFTQGEENRHDEGADHLAERGDLDLGHSV